jgi:hypothetical protein
MISPPMIVLFPLGAAGNTEESCGELSDINADCGAATFAEIAPAPDICAVTMLARIIAVMICSIQHIPHQSLNATFLDK